MSHGLMIVGMVCLLGALPAMATSVRIDTDRMLMVDGQRTFILGLYENPKDDAELKRAAEAGFNLVRCASERSALDRVWSHGVRAWLNTGSAIDLSQDTEERRRALTDMTARFGSHPALLVWEVPDEALWNCWYSALCWQSHDERAKQREAIQALEDKQLAETLVAIQADAEEAFQKGRYTEYDRLAERIWKQLGKESPNPSLKVSTASERAATMCSGMKAGYAVLRSLDPHHPVWMNHAPRNSIQQLAAFNDAADIVGCDIYPVPQYRGGHADIADRSLATIGAYTVRMQQAAPQKPVWMVLQGFAWWDISDTKDERDREVFRRPTFAESRFMAYDAIVRGARGILYWGTEFIEKDSALWKDLLTLARELSGLQPVLSAPDASRELTVEIGETWGSVDRGVVVLGKQAKDGLWLIVVNEWPDPLRYTIAGLADLEGMTYIERVSGMATTVWEGRVSALIPGHEVQVLLPRP